MEYFLMDGRTFLDFKSQSPFTGIIKFGRARDIFAQDKYVLSAFRQ